MGQGNVFTPVCLFTGGLHPEGLHLGDLSTGGLYPEEWEGGSLHPGGLPTGSLTTEGSVSSRICIHPWAEY